ncbi:MAG: Crp/Fnr family transcriptional regulator [Candidatus Sericytochromatia bacterium]
MSTQDNENQAYQKALEILWKTHGKTYKIHDKIFSEGDPGTDIYFILAGAVDIFIGSGNGRRDLWTLVEGDIIGEMALLDQLARTASATASKTTRLVVLDRPTFVQLMGKYPILSLKVIELMGKRMRKMDTQFKIESGYIKGKQMGSSLTPTGDGPLTGTLGPMGSMYSDED